METLEIIEKQNKTIRVTVRLTESQYKKIAEGATKAGIAIATYLRICGLRQQVRARMNEDEVKYYRQLCSMSNSLNTYAKAVNISGAMNLLSEIESTIKNLNSLIEKIGK